MSKIKKSKKQQIISGNKRLAKEIKRLKKYVYPGIDIMVHKNNHRHFIATIDGPEGTPYYGGIFRIEIFCPFGYPLKPPKALFLTKIYHENVDQLGRICLDILKDKWTPLLSIQRLCLSIQLLLHNPYSDDDPLDGKSVESWKKKHQKNG